MSEKQFDCPNCGTIKAITAIDIPDYFLSKEVFTVLSCPNCGLKKTEPVPEPNAIGKYYETDDYLSHGDQQKGLFARMYRLAKGYNLGWKSRLLSQLKHQADFLDYGCGTGDLINHCQAVGFKVRGAEPSSHAIQFASPLVKNLIQIPEKELASKQTYDIISLWHVLEHIHEPKDILSQLRDKLNPGGHLVIALPNNASGDAQHYGKHWAGWDVPRHIWHYEPKQIIQLITDLGLTHQNTKPMWLDAFYVSLLSERYKNGNPVSGIVWATISNIKAIFNQKGKCSSQVYIFKC